MQRALQKDRDKKPKKSEWEYFEKKIFLQDLTLTIYKKNLSLSLTKNYLVT